MPVFVLTNHPREPLTKQGGTSFTFVTDGVEAALERARAAAAPKDVVVAGGATVAQQCLNAGLLDELDLHIAPVLLRGGVRLFAEDDGAPPVEVAIARVVPSSAVTHILYRVASREA